MISQNGFLSVKHTSQKDNKNSKVDEHFLLIHYKNIVYAMLFQICNNSVDHGTFFKLLLIPFF